MIKNPMKFIVLLCLLSFFFTLSCVPKITINNNNTRVIEIEIGYNTISNSLPGFITIDDSFILINLFGPFNKNIAKFLIEKDTITIIDLINSKKNILIFRNGYSLFLNFFNGNNEIIGKDKLFRFLNFLTTALGSEDTIGSENSKFINDSSKMDKNKISYSNFLRYSEIKVAFYTLGVYKQINVKIRKKILRRTDTFKKEKYLLFPCKIYSFDE